MGNNSQGPLAESSTAELLKIKQQTLGEPRLSAITELLLWLGMKCQMWPSPRDISKNIWGGNFPSPSIANTPTPPLLEHRTLEAHRHVPLVRAWAPLGLWAPLPGQSTAWLMGTVSLSQHGLPSAGSSSCLSRCCRPPYPELVAKNTSS